MFDESSDQQMPFHHLVPDSSDLCYDKIFDVKIDQASQKILKLCQKQHQEQYKKQVLLTTKVDQMKVLKNKCKDKMQQFKYYEIQQMLDIEPVLQNVQTPQIQTSTVDKQKCFSLIMNEYQPKKQQKSNKNFIKFLLPKFYIRFHEQIMYHQNDCQQNWIQFNKKLQTSETYMSIKILSNLFQGYDQNNNKRKNRKFLHKILRQTSFYKIFILGSNYIKDNKNRKQYLIAAKIISLRCFSSSLISRIQTK